MEKNPSKVNMQGASCGSRISRLRRKLFCHNFRRLFRWNGGKFNSRGGLLVRQLVLWELVQETVTCRLGRPFDDRYSATLCFCRVRSFTFPISEISKPSSMLFKLFNIFEGIDVFLSASWGIISSGLGSTSLKVFSDSARSLDFSSSTYFRSISISDSFTFVFITWLCNFRRKYQQHQILKINKIIKITAVAAITTTCWKISKNSET